MPAHHPLCKHTCEHVEVLQVCQLYTSVVLRPKSDCLELPPSHLTCDGKLVSPSLWGKRSSRVEQRREAIILLLTLLLPLAP